MARRVTTHTAEAETCRRVKVLLEDAIDDLDKVIAGRSASYERFSVISHAIREADDLLFDLRYGPEVSEAPQAIAVPKAEVPSTAVQQPKPKAWRLSRQE